MGTKYVKEFTTGRWRKQTTLKKEPKQSKFQQWRQQLRRHPVIVVFGSILGVVVVLLTLLSAPETMNYLFGGDFLATAPVILPDDQISPSWEDLPITAKNNSAFFAEQKVKISCGTKEFGWALPNGKYAFGTLKFPLWSLANGAPSDIPQETLATFSCDFYRNDLVFLANRPFGPFEQTPLLLVRGYIKIQYKTTFLFFKWTRQEVSPPLTWRALSANGGGYQWLENDTRDPPALSPSGK